jgi:hypothetical protein
MDRRPGFQPELSLVYSTGHGNRPYGLGWSLSVPGVTRQTSKGVPRYDDATDVFVLSGAEDLVPLPGGPPRATRYEPRTEGLYARIDHHRDRAANHDFWEVRSKDGLVSRYGTPGAAGADPAAVAAPASGADPAAGAGASSPGSSPAPPTRSATGSSSATSEMRSRPTARITGISSTCPRSASSTTVIPTILSSSSRSASATKIADPFPTYRCRL